MSAAKNMTKSRTKSPAKTAVTAAQKRTTRIARAAGLPAWTAGDLMTPNPVSIRSDATVTEAAGFLGMRGIAAAPVIDEAGRAIGVISRTDIVRHIRGGAPGDHPHTIEYYQAAELALPAGADPSERFGAAAAAGGTATVGSIMTPLVYSVPVKASSAEVVDALVGCKVHRLFVTDAGGVVVGVVTAMDVLRKLRG